MQVKTQLIESNLLQNFRGLFFIFQLFAGGCQHQFQAVFLVDFGCRRVVVNGHDIDVFVQILNRARRALADDVVGQTPERLRADDILRSAFVQRQHFCGNQPALAHFYSLVDNSIRASAEIFEIVRGLETALFKEANNPPLYAQ